MSNFEVKIRRLTVSPHANADALEIGTIDGYQFVVRKGDFQTGDLIAYIPEAAILPAPLIEELGLTGRLAGAEANRVKAIKLRGVLSQGLAYRPAVWPSDWVEGADVTEQLDIVKYEPPIPLEMSGLAEPAPTDGIFRSYDVEDIKKYPNVLAEDEEVVYTEKLHGSFTLVGLIKGQRVVSSKGMASKRLVLTETEGNIYWRIAKQLNLFDKLQAFVDDRKLDQALLFGEVLGVQDLLYGLNKGKLGYRAFDIFTLNGFLPFDELQTVCEQYDIPLVPVLYRGPFSYATLKQHTSGKSTLANHIREGVVVKPVVERDTLDLGRVLLKSVSPEYLTRSGGTELN